MGLFWLLDGDDKSLPEPSGSGSSFGWIIKFPLRLHVHAAVDLNDLSSDIA